MVSTRIARSKQLNATNPLLSLTSEVLVHLAAQLSNTRTSYGSLVDGTGQCLSRLALVCTSFDSSFIYAVVCKAARAQGRAIPQVIPSPTRRLDYPHDLIGGLCWPEWFDREDNPFQASTRSPCLNTLRGQVYACYAACNPEMSIFYQPSFALAIAPSGGARLCGDNCGGTRLCEIVAGSDPSTLILTREDLPDELPCTIRCVTGGLKFGWGECALGPTAGQKHPAGQQLTQFGDISLLCEALEEECMQRCYFFFRPVASVTDADFASLDLTNIQPTWVPLEPHKEGKIIKEYLKQRLSETKASNYLKHQAQLILNEKKIH